MRSRQFSFDAQSVNSAAFPLLGPVGSAAAPTYSFSTATGMGMYARTTSLLAFSVSGSERISVSTASVTIRSDATYGFSINTDPSSGSDVMLSRDGAAGILALKNAITGAAQTFRVYGTTSSKYGALLHDGTITQVIDSGGSGVRISATGANLGFYGTAPIALQTGVALTVTAIKTALVNLGLCT